jgi:hypothetical protein
VDHLIDWCGFLGAWLLVAGPLHQASRELEEEELQREELTRAAAAVESPPPVSRWWWLLPPLAYLLHRRRSNAYRRRVAQALSREQLAAIVSYRDKADAWSAVAAGGFLIAVTETWGLRETEGWPESVFWALIIVMCGLCIANTVRRMQRRRVRS